MTKHVQARLKKPERERKLRISARVREAIRLMVEEGLKRSEAAERAGLRDNSLYVAMRRPDILAFRTELMRVLRSAAASKSIARIDELAAKAVSEHVRLAANELLLGLDGHVPIARTEGRVLHEHAHRHHTPGLIIIRHDRACAAEHEKLEEGQSIRLIDAQTKPRP